MSKLNVYDDVSLNLAAFIRFPLRLGRFANFEDFPLSTEGVLWGVAVVQGFAGHYPVNFWEKQRDQRREFQREQKDNQRNGAYLWGCFEMQVQRCWRLTLTSRWMRDYCHLALNLSAWPDANEDIRGQVTYWQTAWLPLSALPSNASNHSYSPPT